MRRSRRVALAALAVLLVVAGVGPAQANRTDVSVQILSVQTTIAPDGRSMRIDIEVRCDRKATIVEARVTATQPQASGAGPFTPFCNRLANVVVVNVPATAGTFQTGSAQVSARLVVRQGSTKSASDSATVRVRPSVGVDVADRAVLQDGGRSVRIDVAVTCPRTSTPQGGQVTVFQWPVGGTATFGPTPCDGLPHTHSLTVAANGGVFQLGSADAESFASVEEGGDQFFGSTIETIQIVAG